MANKPKWENGSCSEACRNWICCQDCERRKQLCKNHCKQALNTKICKHFKEKATEEAFDFILKRISEGVE